MTNDALSVLSFKRRLLAVKILLTLAAHSETDHTELARLLKADALHARLASHHYQHSGRIASITEAGRGVRLIR